MAYTESIEKDAQMYEEEYGHLPNTQEELIKYLIKNSKVKPEKIQEEIDKINAIPWKTMQLDLDVLPYATPRPRNSNGVFYVRGAKKHKRLLKSIITEYNIIYTQTRFVVRTFQPTPKAMSQMDRILFEMGVARPLADPDWDNLGKTYSDMVQKILITNDNIITSSNVEKFYSIKPRVQIEISYQCGFDTKFNERRVINSKSFKELVTDRYDINSH